MAQSLYKQTKWRRAVFILKTSETQKKYQRERDVDSDSQSGSVFRWPPAAECGMRNADLRGLRAIKKRRVHYKFYNLFFSSVCLFFFCLFGAENRWCLNVEMSVGGVGVGAPWNRILCLILIWLGRDPHTFRRRLGNFLLGRTASYTHTHTPLHTGTHVCVSERVGPFVYSAFNLTVCTIITADLLSDHPVCCWTPSCFQWMDSTLTLLTW